MRAEERARHFYKMEEALLTGEPVSEACKRIGVSRAWYYKVRRWRAGYVAANFADRRRQARRVLEQELRRIWGEGIGNRRSVAGAVRAGLQFGRDERAAIFRREKPALQIPTHTARRVWKEWGAIWDRRRKRWGVRELSELAALSRVKQVAERPTVDLLSAAEVAEKLRQWWRRRLSSELERAIAAQPDQGELRWRLMRAAAAVAREGSHSRKARFWSEAGWEIHPRGGGFSCEWAMQHREVMRRALRVVPRPARAPVSPGPDYCGSQVFEGDAPVPSAYRVLADAVRAGTSLLRLGTAVEGATEEIRREAGVKVTGLACAELERDKARAQIEAQLPAMIRDVLEHRLQSWWVKESRVRSAP